VIHLSTYSFQAPAFYESQGYKRVGTVPGSPQGAKRYFYSKRLRAKVRKSMAKNRERDRPGEVQTN
jgi:hypothetical protein